VVLQAGDSRQLTVDAQTTFGDLSGVEVRVWTADGVLVTNCAPTLLDKGGKIYHGSEDSGLGVMFQVPRGHYRAVIDRPGKPDITEGIDAAVPTQAGSVQIMDMSLE
jgi:hypothetical protein